MKKICFEIFFQKYFNKIMQSLKNKEYSQANYKDKIILEESQGLNKIRRF